MSLVDNLLSNMNKRATSSKAYLAGDHAQHTWGVTIPAMGFQWVIGSSTVLPCQRYFGVSGVKKSYKSTLMIEIGNWFMEAGGVHSHLDTEHKTSPVMLDAMTWHRPGLSHFEGAIPRVFKEVGSIEEWQTLVTAAIETARSEGVVKAGNREPMFITVDSLTGRANEGADVELRKEGASAERGFPVSANQITRYLETLNLMGTITAVGWVQHLKKSMEQTGGYGGPDMKEKGPSAAEFSCSTHLRITKGASIHMASHPLAPIRQDLPVEGNTLWVKCNMTCIGPGERTLAVDLLWQHVPQEDGSTRQVMWFDWEGALGRLLVNMKYSDKFKPKLYKQDRERLDAALKFTQLKTTTVKCDELGIENGTHAELGKAIMDNDDVRRRVSNFLGIVEFPSFQTAEIDFSAGNIGKKKSK